ncbi:hypothetical protein ANCCAN_21354 [Ancylostoma caninum]|uniref:Uncharacterized protein n=1 Tax=Ancylostoma caninum TaxID=29170 RepID=A0A368FKT0_ANCCA|nr:hypothetical protein ANCCAN_21354 [Ancylostoma caninum]
MVVTFFALMATKSEEVSGKRPKGRPTQRWLDTVHGDLKTARIHPDQAHDRTLWRQKMSKVDSAAKREKR